MALEEDEALAHIPSGEGESEHKYPSLLQEPCQIQADLVLGEVACQHRVLAVAWLAICAAPGSGVASCM